MNQYIPREKPTVDQLLASLALLNEVYYTDLAAYEQQWQVTARLPARTVREWSAS